MTFQLSAEQIHKDIAFLKTHKQFKDSRDSTVAFLLHDKTSRERRKYKKQKGQWCFCGVFSIEEVSMFYKRNKL